MLAFCENREMGKGRIIEENAKAMNKKTICYVFEWKYGLIFNLIGSYS
jgi:hypothetical protein